MKPLTLCSIAFRDEPIAELMPWIAETGFDAVEIFNGQLEELDDRALLALKEQAAELKVEILSIAPYFWLTQNDELREESMRIAEQVIHRARLLGASKIRTFTDAGPTGIGSAEATADHWKQAVGCLKVFTDAAPELRFVVETHAKTLADTAESCLRLIEEVAAPNLKLLFQPGDRLWIPEFERLFPHIEHMHLHNHSADGKPCGLADGVMDLRTFLAEAKAAGYNHSIALEHCWKGSTRADLEAGLAALKELV